MQVSLFFTESPTNPFLRCVDIKLVSEMCHKKGAVVCIDGTFATPMNQKALALGADLVVHSATKYIAGHNDVSQPALHKTLFDEKQYNLQFSLKSFIVKLKHQ